MFILSFRSEPKTLKVYSKGMWIPFQAFIPFSLNDQEMFLVASRRQQLHQIKQGSGEEKPWTEVHVVSNLFAKIYVFTAPILDLMECNAFGNRQMRGEELRGLSIEELQQLERSLEVGLTRVIEKKVSLFFYSNTGIFLNFVKDYLLTGFS